MKHNHCIGAHGGPHEAHAKFNKSKDLKIVSFPDFLCCMERLDKCRFKYLVYGV